MADHRICVIAGDGIGPEVTACAERVLTALVGRVSGLSVTFEAQPGGHQAFRQLGSALPAKTLEAARAADAVLVGAMDVAQLPPEEPEPLTQLRKALAVNASVRPARSIEALAQSILRIDTVVVREVTEGLYSGIEYRAGADAACAVRLITRDASVRAARVAFEQAMLRRRRVTAIHKLGALKLTDGIFLDAAREVAGEFPDVQLETRNVDACALELVREPEHFDVILSTNAFGDIISDLAIGIAGGLGLAPSACIGDRWAYFEPVHGTAPDIAGKGIANPTATILSAAMMMRHLGEIEAAERIERAVMAVLEAGAVRTGDLGGKAGSAEMTDAIIQALDAE